MAPAFEATIEWQMKSSVLLCRISEGARVKGRLHRGSAALWHGAGMGQTSRKGAKEGRRTDYSKKITKITNVRTDLRFIFSAVRICVNLRPSAVCFVSG